MLRYPLMRERWGPDVLCAVCHLPGCDVAPNGGPHMTKDGKTAYYHEKPCYNDLLEQEAEAAQRPVGLSLAFNEL